jgi:hypothetical protein
LNEVDLGLPTLLFESALADVIVAGRAGKGKVIGQHYVQRLPVFLFPRSIPFANEFFVR